MPLHLTASDARSVSYSLTRRVGASLGSLAAQAAETGADPPDLEALQGGRLARRLTPGGWAAGRRCRCRCRCCCCCCFLGGVVSMAGVEFEEI